MIKVTKKTQEVLIDIKAQDRKHKRHIKSSLHDIGQLFVNKNQNLINTGRRTGRLYRIDGRTHQASAPGEPPKTISGRLARSADYRVASWQQMSVGQTQDYAKYLESGTRHIKPRTNVLLAINQISGDSVRILGSYKP